MASRDFRSLDEETQAELRRLAFKQLDKGKTKHEVGEFMEVHWKTVEDWMRKRFFFEQNSFKGEKRGRRKGEQLAIQDKNAQKIKECILQKTPQECGLETSLWDRKAIQELIRKVANLQIVLQTVSKYTKRWGMTPQRPKKYASEQKQESIDKWLTESYPEIVKRAKKEGAEIQWADETGLSLNAFYGRSYSQTGVTPHIKIPSRKASIAMISSISNTGNLRFMMYEGGMNTDLFIVFLRRLTHDMKKKKVFLIVDNLRVHHAKKVQQWVKKHIDRLEIFFPTELCTSIQS